MRNRRRSERARRRTLVVGKSQRQRPVQHGEPARFEVLELREPVLDPVERLPDVEAREDA